MSWTQIAVVTNGAIEEENAQSSQAAWWSAASARLSG